jgi:hypothetical protein
MALRNQEFLHYFHANFIKITQNQFRQQFQSTINNKKIIFQTIHMVKL